MIALATSGMAVTGVFRDPWKSGAKEVDSPDRVGIFDPQLKVEQRIGINTEAAENTEFTETESETWLRPRLRPCRWERWIGIKLLPHPRVFFAKSSELHENKRVEFLIGAEKCKRVWKSMKIKGMNGNQIGMPEC